MRTLPDYVVSILFVMLFPISLDVSAQDSSQSSEKHNGSAPRASAAKYHSHAERDGFSVGAELLSKKDASKVFAGDVNRCCLVVQVAVYPKKDEPIDLSLFDFALIEISADKPVRPESPTTVAEKLADRKNPRGGVDVASAASVGYESGTYTDPVTGQPVHVHAVSASASVGVSSGNPTPPDIGNLSREIIEHELYEKGLPEAKVSISVAGYLYFPIPNAKKNAKYQLVCSGRHEPVTLPLP